MSTPFRRTGNNHTQDGFALSAFKLVSPAGDSGCALTSGGNTSKADLECFQMDFLFPSIGFSWLFFFFPQHCVGAARCQSKKTEAKARAPYASYQKNTWVNIPYELPVGLTHILFIYHERQKCCYPHTIFILEVVLNIFHLPLSLHKPQLHYLHLSLPWHWYDSPLQGS